MLWQQINNFVAWAVSLAMFAQQVMAVSHGFCFVGTSTRLSLIAGAVLAALQANHLCDSMHIMTPASLPHG
jgi:predicted dienelactone hydrolase